MKRLVAVLMILALAAGAVLAQNKASLQIQCNQSGAQVYLNGRLAGTTSPNLAILVNPGPYSLKVTKPGFLAYDANITVPGSGLVLQVNLVMPGAVVPVPQPQPSTFALTVTANAPNSEVLINGLSRGRAPVTVQVAPGQYQVTVRSPNTFPFEQTVTVTNAPVTVNAGALQPQTYNVNVSANVAGAQVFLNGNLAGSAPFSASLAPGSYTLVVRAPNYLDFTQNLSVNGPVQVMANLQPQVFSLSVSANVGGAQVLLNGNLAGTAPFSANLAPGSYALTVRAPNYVDYVQNLVISGPVQVAATLQPQNFGLSVQANVVGAQVFLNGNAVGQAPYNAQLAPGSYTLIVKAAGFTDYAETFTLTGPKTVTATLQPMMASFQLSIPKNAVNEDAKGGHWSQIQIYVDGSLLKAPGKDPVTGSTVSPGKHTIRVTSGALASETVIDFQAGKAYTIELALSLSVK